MPGLLARKVKTAFKMIFTQPRQLVVALGQYGAFSWLTDRACLKLVFWAEMGERLDLSRPKTFSQKLQWLKIHDHQERYRQMVDKYAVRGLIQKKYGEEYLIPLLAVYDSPEEIEWESLPEKFVIKCTHGSGCNLVCNGKASFDTRFACAQIKAWMKKNWFHFGREWAYKSVRPRIIIEQFVSDGEHATDLTDYKLYCFEGKPMYCQVIAGRRIRNDKAVYDIDFYDQNWIHMPFSGMKRNSPHAAEPHARPKSYEAMLRIARELAQDTHFVRVDFYEIEGQPKFGEFTLYPLSGFGAFEPEEWNKRLGDLIKLPVDNNPNI